MVKVDLVAANVEFPPARVSVALQQSGAHLKYLLHHCVLPQIVLPLYSNENETETEQVLRRRKNKRIKKNAKRKRGNKGQLVKRTEKKKTKEIKKRKM